MSDDKIQVYENEDFYITKDQLKEFVEKINHAKVYGWAIL